MRHIRMAALVALALWGGGAYAESARPVSPDGLWQRFDVMPLAAGRQPWVHPPKFRGYRLERDVMEAVLGQAPSEEVAPEKRANLIINLPRPDGTFERFSVVESQVMEDGLAAKFPSIHTYAAQGLDDPTARARLDMTPLGFHAQVFSARGGYYIDPYWREDRATYASYFLRDYKVAGKEWTCGVVSEAASSAPPAPALARGPDLLKSNGDNLRKFRVAIAAPGEYTTFFGGTVTGAIAGIVTTLNRVNQLYENDLSIRMLLVANNNLIVYTNASTDPYTITSCTGFMLTLNQNNIDAEIGDANYDIGHVVNASSGGGLATLGVVCQSGSKARGCTGSTSPVGDAYDIDYVAHEMGHEFHADHTFNGSSGSCSGSNRNGPTAYEPGSSSTIMGYAGICGADNLQAHSDAYFHFASISQIVAFVETSATCSTNSATTNSIPTVNAGADYTIPKSTPFELTATGSDTNGDTLTYCWEEKDLGSQSALSAPDDGVIPLFRSYSPTTSPTRIFPQLWKILSNVSSNDEKLPSLPRTMRFRVTVRDNRAGGGAVNDDDAVLTVVTQAGPFRVSSPNTSVTWSGLSTVTWSVAGTDLSPVNTTNVNIYLSTNSGVTFDTVLASNTPNDGSQTVTLPNITISNARIKVRATTNVFFDIGDTDFTIMPFGPFFAVSGPQTIDDAAGNSSGGMDPGESGVKLYVRLQNTGLSSASNVSATLTSLTATAVVTTPGAAYPNMAPSGTASNSTPFVVSLLSAHACTSPVNFRITVAAADATNSADFSVSPGFSQVFTNSFNITTNIPDNNTNGVNIPFVIPDHGMISDVDFRFDGSSCSTNAASTTVGLNHSWVGDLVVKLTSPTGTVVTLMSRPGSANCQGHNFCQTRLDDDGAFPSIQSIAQNGTDSPHTGTWRPTNSLSAFDLQSAGGTWILNVSDRGALDTGTVRAFSLIVTATGCSTVTNLDFDSDGMPDAWETSYGLNPNVSNSPSADADNDRVSDLSEYIADTVPTNGTSYLKLNVISNTGPRSLMFGPSSTGRVYTLEYLDDLLLGIWSNIPGQVDLPGDGTSQDILTDTNTPPDRRMYRIGVELP